MSELSRCKKHLEAKEEQFIHACQLVMKMPLPSNAAYSGFYYQNDGVSLCPIRYVGFSDDHFVIAEGSCSFEKIAGVSWSWSNRAINRGLHDEGEEYLFRWISVQWKKAGGEGFSGLCVIFDHGINEALEIRTLRALSHSDIAEFIAD